MHNNVFGNDIVIKEKSGNLEIVIDNKETRVFQPQNTTLESIIVRAYRGYITMGAINWLNWHKVSLSFLNVTGQIKSSINPSNTQKGILTLNQFQIHENKEMRMKFARRLIQDKVNSQYNFLSDLQKYFQIKIPEIELNEMNELKTITDIMNYEGRYARKYWEGMKSVITQIDSTVSFSGRDTRDSNGRNAGNFINASLNYLYAVLEHQVRTSLFATGFDSTIGILHETTTNKQPLIYDLMEPFRYLADMSLIDLLSKRKLNKRMFTLQPNYVMTCNPSTAKLLIDQIQYNLSRKIKTAGQNRTVYTRIDEYVTHWKKSFLSHSLPSIKIPNLPIEMNLEASMKQRIAEMSYTEANEIGLNKSTLYYLKHRQQTKIYGKVMQKLNGKK